MSQVIDELKAKVAAQDAALDTISTNVTGVQGDITALKQKIADLIAGGGGATPAELAELGTAIDGVGAKIATLSTTTADLDAQTDSATV